MSHVADVLGTRHGGKVGRLAVNVVTAAEAVAPVAGAAEAAKDVGTLENKAIDATNQYCEVRVAVAAFDASANLYTTDPCYVRKVATWDLALG